MKNIFLTKGQFAIVDDHWFDYLRQWDWEAQWSEDINGFYAVRREGKKPNRRKILMHRVVAKTPDGMICEHIHHNTLDNRESELRNVNPTQSIINRGIAKNNKTGTTGITRRSGSNKYRATLIFQEKMVLDRSFNTLEEAIKSRSDAEKKYFGEYAYQEDVS